jgi:hypothetical protein
MIADQRLGHWSLSWLRDSKPGLFPLPYERAGDRFAFARGVHLCCAHRAGSRARGRWLNTTHVLWISDHCLRTVSNSKMTEDLEKPKTMRRITSNGDFGVTDTAVYHWTATSPLTKIFDHHLAGAQITVFPWTREVACPCRDFQEQHKPQVFATQPICMKLLHLERRISDDDIIISKTSSLPSSVALQVVHPTTSSTPPSLPLIPRRTLRAGERRPATRHTRKTTPDDWLRCHPDVS